MFSALPLARALAAKALRLLLFWQLLRTALRLAFAACLAVIVGGLVMGADVPFWSLVLAPGAIVLATLVGIAADRTQAAGESDVTGAVRRAAGERLAAMPARRVQALDAGRLIVGLQRHPEAVAALVVGHRAAGIMMAAGPLAAALALATVSWQAALLVLALSPVMIVFFVLLGDTIRKRARTQEGAFGHLAGQFADRLRALPTILANDALVAEEAKLTQRLTRYADRTMAVLRVAFLNAGAIDFFTSLSIAMLAVFLGLGHLKLAMIPGFSNLELWQSLFILMAAPEYFSAFRRYAEQYHAKAEGQAGAEALDALLNTSAPEGPPPSALHWLDRESLTQAGLVVILGPSGSGKTTLLRRLAGVDDEAAARAACWISTDAFVPAGTLGEALRWNLGAVSDAACRRAACAVGLLDDALLPGGLDAPVDEGGSNLSGGQRLRIAIGRALLSSSTVFADEPTAKLDPGTAEAIRSLLREIAGTRLVVAASHDPALAALADRVVDLSREAMAEPVP